MKKAAVWLGLILVLTGCGRDRERIDRAMELRARLLTEGSCSFCAAVTADYGDELYEFVMDCTGDSQGNLSFTVTKPDTIAGITGSLSAKTGQLIFDDTALEFPLLAEGQLAPVSAPWVFLKTLRSGYLTAAGDEGDLLRLTIDDTYEEDALHLDIWLDEQNIPVQADILYDGRRILSMEIGSFRIG